MTSSVDCIQLIQRGELPCLQIRHPRASALIALQGAQVLEFTPSGGRPLIWLSETASFKRGQSVRGGIPVCWPWFGDLQRNPAAVQSCIGQDKAPAHGWVRNLPWLLESSSTDDSGVSLHLRYPLPLGIPVPWAEGVELHLRLHLGDALEIHLETLNYSQQMLHLSQALHSYFAISHVDQVCVQGLQRVRHIDTMRDWQIVSDQEPLHIQGETDRIYLDVPPEIVLEDQGWQRRIHLQCRQSRSAVVWNPWIEKAKRLSDFAEDAYQRMLCIETARVMDDCLKLAPGERDIMRLRLWQSAL